MPTLLLGPDAPSCVVLPVQTPLPYSSGLTWSTSYSLGAGAECALLPSCIHSVLRPFRVATA